MTVSRNGVALFAALSLLALLGLLTVGAFASITLAQRTERLHLSDDALAAATENALATVAGGLTDLPFDTTRTFAVSVEPARVRATVAATRTSVDVVWLVADAFIPGLDSAHRRANLVARFRSIGPMPVAPITVRGGAALGDSAVVTADTTGDADCRLRPGGSMTAQRADSVSFFLSARQLAALDSAPNVRHVRGDTTIAGGAFNGIMIVDGDATITGAFTLEGLLAARGRIVSSSGLFVHGAILSFSGNPSAVQLDRSRVDYSMCALRRVFRAALGTRIVRGRAWAEVF